MSAYRYALYYAPAPETALAAFGASWLGRDADTGAERPQPAVPGLSPEALHEITADPRRYGFHGTLKPPFVLAEGSSEDSLLAAVASFARARAPFTLPLLKLVSLDGFLALVPSAVAPALDRLARDCVIGFDDFRALPSAAEIARRRQAGLSLRQEGLLARWGYPYVLDAYRFHLTLTRRLRPEEAAILLPALEPLTAPLCGAAVAVDALTVFVEPAPGAPFTVAARFSFDASS